MTIQLEIVSTKNIPHHHHPASSLNSLQRRSINKRFSRLETHVISLARTLAQLGNDLRHQAVSSRQIDQLRVEVNEVRTTQACVRVREMMCSRVCICVQEGLKCTRER